MGAGRIVAYHDSPENREVCGDAGLPFDARRPESLTRIFDALVDDPASAAVFAEKARARVQERYRWEAVAEAYERAMRGE
jgi:glycosyltransferase involved in cell wall biosynthesis